MTLNVCTCTCICYRDLSHMECQVQNYLGSLEEAQRERIQVERQLQVEKMKVETERKKLSLAHEALEEKVGKVNPLTLDLQPPPPPPAIQSVHKCCVKINKLSIFSDVLHTFDKLSIFSDFFPLHITVRIKTMIIVNVIRVNPKCA